MDSIHDRFASEVSQKEGDALMDYLLKAARTYERVCTEDLHVTEQDMEADLGISMPKNERDESKEIRPQELSIFGCPCSSHAHVCNDTENACLVCMQCGRVAHTGFVHSVRDFSCVDATCTYVYQPKTYLTRHLDHLEGFRHPRLPPSLLQDVRKDLTSRGVCLTKAMPNDVYESLKRLKLARLYPHRWAVTWRVNPTYQPLCFSEDLRERLHRVFLSCYMRYASQRHKTGRKRKFLSYLFFIQHTLPFLHVNVADVHFKPLKNRSLSEKYARELHCLLRGDPL